MPGWIASILVQLGVFIVEHYGLPYLESKWPSLIPLLDEILSIVKKQQTPSEHLSKAADHYNNLCSGIACSTPLQHE